MNILRRLFYRAPSPTLKTALASVTTRHLRYGQISDVGRTRDSNQDACLTLVSRAWDSLTAERQPGGAQDDCSGDRAEFGLFVVADGMGGHQHGERASSLAVRVMAQNLTDQTYLPWLMMNNHHDPAETILGALNDAIRAANAAVAEDVPDGGTTLTAVVVYGNYAYIAHVGDSRAYLITRDDPAGAPGVQIHRLTRDHSLVQRLIELDQLTPEQAAEHPHRNVLYRAIGQSDHLELDNRTVYLPPGSRLLLCSDGLWNMVSESVIANIVIEVAPQQACEQLVAAANDQGGLDNITAVLIQLPG